MLLVIVTITNWNNLTTNKTKAQELSCGASPHKVGWVVGDSGGQSISLWPYLGLSLTAPIYPRGSREKLPNRMLVSSLLFTPTEKKFHDMSLTYGFLKLFRVNFAVFIKVNPCSLI